MVGVDVVKTKAQNVMEDDVFEITRQVMISRKAHTKQEGHERGIGFNSSVSARFACVFLPAC